MSRLPPPPADIEAIERATLGAVAAGCTEVIGPWILGLRPGPVGRAHSAAPLSHNLVSDEGLLARIEAAYRARDLAPAFRLADVEGLAGVADALAARGYQPAQPTLVMTGEVRAVADLAPSRGVELLERPDEGWTSVFLGQGFDPVEGAARAAILAQAPQTTFGAVREGGETLAVGALSLGEGWASLHGMRTRQACRGRGLAGQVMAALAAHAIEAGVSRIFLQVEVGNDPALALYGRAGFAQLWRYHYWRSQSAFR